MQNTDRSFFSEKYERTFDELQQVREKLRSALVQIADAEEALKFYADSRNYLPERLLNEKVVFQGKIKDDYAPADNDLNTFIAGRRAREYISRYAK